MKNGKSESFATKIGAMKLGDRARVSDVCANSDSTTVYYYLFSLHEDSSLRT